MVNTEVNVLEQGANKTKNDPLALANSDHPGAQLVASVFNGSNFLSWSRAVKLALGAKNKLGLINGGLAASDNDSDEEERFLRADYMVRCWILNSMIGSISEGFMYVDSTKELWDEVNERFGQSNGPLLYQLKRGLGNLTQGSMNVVEYYGKLKRAWDEIFSLEGYPDCHCKRCNCDVNKRIQELANTNKLMQFLLGLNDNFENVRSSILAMDPFPSINKAYYLVQQVEKQKSITAGNDQSSNGGASQESSALNANRGYGRGKNSGGYFGNNNYNGGQSGQSFGTSRGNSGPTGSYLERKEVAKKAKMEKKCNHCNQRGHTVDECFKIHGYPEWFQELKNKNRTTAAVSEMEESSLSFGEGTSSIQKQGSQMDNVLVNVCQEMREMLRMMKGKGLTEFSGMVFVMNSFKNDKEIASSWIIDTGASDHMTCNSSLLSLRRKLHRNVSICLPDGSVKYVDEIGDIKLTNGLFLKGVFLVPEFKQNLLSVGKLLDDNQLDVSLDKRKCVFQDLKNGKELLRGTRHEGGLYRTQLKP